MTTASEVGSLLQRLLQVRGVVGVAVAGADGGLVDGMAAGGSELAALEELIPSALASSRALGALIGEGPVEQSLVEYPQGPVLLAPLGPVDEDGGGHVVVVGLQSVNDLGRVRYQLKRLLPALERGLRAGVD